MTNIPTACKVMGCPSPALPRSTLCASHTLPKRLRNEARWEHDKFYSTARWKKLRLWKLAQNPVCQRCLNAAAQEVDHIIPRRAGGDDMALDNLQSLCTSCHATKTMNDRRGEGLSRT